MGEKTDKLNFHVQSDDYFLYLAALLGFVEETLSSGDTLASVQIQLAAIKSTRQDLRNLHDKYRIEARDTL